jgi:hypothetical protein
VTAGSGVACYEQSGYGYCLASTWQSCWIYGNKVSEFLYGNCPTGQVAGAGGLCVPWCDTNNAIPATDPACSGCVEQQLSNQVLPTGSADYCDGSCVIHLALSIDSSPTVDSCWTFPSDPDASKVWCTFSVYRTTQMCSSSTEPAAPTGQSATAVQNSVLAQTSSTAAQTSSSTAVTQKTTAETQAAIAAAAPGTTVATNASVAADTAANASLEASLAATQAALDAAKYALAAQSISTFEQNAANAAAVTAANAAAAAAQTAANEAIAAAQAAAASASTAPVPLSCPAGFTRVGSNCVSSSAGAGACPEGFTRDAAGKCVGTAATGDLGALLAGIKGLLSGAGWNSEAASTSTGAGYQTMTDSVNASKDVVLDHGWTWGVTVPTAACTPWTIATGDKSLSLDICPIAEKIRDLGAYVLYILTAIGLFNILTGRNQNA